MAGKDDLVPPVSWAQRRKELWISYDAPHATDVSMLSPTDGEDLILRFVDRNTLQPFCCHIHFYAPVKSVLGMPTVLSKCVRLRLVKREAAEWPRLTKERVKDIPFLVTYNWDLDATLDEDSTDPDDSSSSTSSGSVCKCDESRVEELDDDGNEVETTQPTSKTPPPDDARATAKVPAAPSSEPRPAAAPLKPRPKAQAQQFDLAQVLLIIAITSLSSVLVTYLWAR